MSTATPLKVLVMAGGTGGHVFPALAVAERLRAQGHEIVWIGTAGSFESRKVPEHGFALEYIRVRGLRGKGWKSLLGAPLLLARSLLDALAVLRRQRPAVVLGMGGYAAGPGGLAAWLLRRPLVIHEQNAAAGLTNRVLARLARTVLEAFPRTFARAQTVGNPVRAGFSAVPAPETRIATHAGPLRVLVVGGSLGAKALNTLVPAALAQFAAESRPQVRHQAGRTLDVALAAYRDTGVAAEISAFIDDMPAAYAWADLVICRAGASTVAELAASGSAALLVPFPYAVDDHQTRNGEFLVQAGAAQLVQERELDGARLAALLRDLLADPVRLRAMGQAARRVAWTDAAERIAAACLRAARPQEASC